MPKRKRKRPSKVETLADLFGGDIVILETFDGDVEVRVGFFIGSTCFVRTHDENASDLESYPENHPVKEVVRLMPTSISARKTRDTEDPLLQ